MSTLADIRVMFRSLTAQPSQLDITDAEIDSRVNVVYQQELPSNLKMFNLKTTYQFYTQPNVDTYFFDRNTYYSIEPPAYVGGIQSNYLQDRQNFFNYWPKIAYLQQIAIGDGATVTFSFTTGFGFLIRSIDPLFQPYNYFKEIVITAVKQLDGSPMIIVDDGGSLNDNGNLIIEGTSTVVGTINYVTGVLTVTFPSAPKDQDIIQIQYTPFQPGRPQTILFYDDFFTIRPIPDTIYEVVINAYIQPSALLASGDHPYLDQWWQLLALAAAKNWFRDQLATDELQKIMPMYEEQVSFVTRRTLQQLTNQRTSTLFTDNRFIPYGLFPPYF